MVHGQKLVYWKLHGLDTETPLLRTAFLHLRSWCASMFSLFFLLRWNMLNLYFKFFFGGCLLAKTPITSPWFCDSHGSPHPSARPRQPVVQNQEPRPRPCGNPPKRFVISMDKKPPKMVISCDIPPKKSVECLEDVALSEHIPSSKSIDIVQPPQIYSWGVYTIFRRKYHGIPPMQCPNGICRGYNG